jgi:hypothetical protein
MDPECSVPRSQHLAIGPYPKRNGSSPHLQPCFAKIGFNIIRPPTHSSSELSLRSSWPTKILYAFLIFLFQARLILLDLINLIFCGAFKLWGSSSCSFLQPLRPHLDQILSYVPLTRQTRFHSHTKQQVQLYFWKLKCFRFRQQTGIQMINKK